MCRIVRLSEALHIDDDTAFDLWQVSDGKVNNNTSPVVGVNVHYGPSKFALHFVNQLL